MRHAAKVIMTEFAVAVMNIRAALTTLSCPPPGRIRMRSERICPKWGTDTARSFAANRMWRSMIQCRERRIR